MTDVERMFKIFWKAVGEQDGFERKHKFTHGSIQDHVKRENGTVTYRLWGHPIATLSNGVLSLSDEGYQTVTTMDRLDGILSNAPGRVKFLRVYQRQRVWHLAYRNWQRNMDRALKFKWNSGAQIALDDPFRLLEHINENEIARQGKKNAQRVKTFVDRIKKRVDDGTLSTDGGECWQIKGILGGNGCDNCEFLLKPGCGGGITLVAKALQERGYAYPGIWIGEIEKGKAKVSLKKIQENWKYPIAASLRKYVRVRLDRMAFERRKADSTTA